MWGREPTTLEGHGELNGMMEEGVQSKKSELAGLGENAGDVYLLKLPSRLAAAWSEAADGTLLAEIVVNEDSKAVLEVREGAGLTKRYEMGQLMDASDLNTRPFRIDSREVRSETADGDVVVEKETRGTIVSGRPRAVIGLTPHTGKAYRRDCRSRMFESLQSSHIVQAIEPAEVEAARDEKTLLRQNADKKRALTDDNDDESSKPTAKKAKTSADKVDKNSLRAHIFRLLAGKSENDLLTYKEIITTIANELQFVPPEQLLKDTLSEFCRKIYKPGRIVLYALKPEYQRSPAAMPSSLSTSSQL